jgi:threonine dehydrogenase-like Zn-dependent dehydrogenase
LPEEVAALTDRWGADVVFEASGSPQAFQGIFDLPRPGGCLVIIEVPLLDEPERKMPSVPGFSFQRINSARV